MQGYSKKNTSLWFKSSVAGGFLLALITVGVAVATYRFVAGHLAFDHLSGEAERYAAILESRALEGVETSAELTELSKSLVGENPGKVAWFRVLARSGEAIAESGESHRNVFDDEDLRQVLERQRRSVVERISTADGDVLVALLPFRFQLRSETAGAALSQIAAGPRFKLVEVAPLSSRGRGRLRAAET